MMQYVIVAELPEPLRSELAPLRKEIDVWSKSWLPPHVTIVRPFTIAMSELMMAEFARPISLTAQILRWATFRNPNNNVLYLEPTPEPFQKLRRNLLDRVPELMKRDQSGDAHKDFDQDPKFHITVAAGVPDEDIGKIYSKVSQKTYMNVFRIHNLSLYSMESRGFWEIDRP